MDLGTENVLNDPALPVQIGESLAEKYRLDRLLGRGGMGVVVAAHHKGLGETVAIKFLLPSLASDPAVVARFLREGRAAVRIRSEHVARVLDVGTLTDGAPFLVMEFLDGQDLQKIIHDRHQLPIAEAVDLVLQACEAVAEAHSLGIIHRDLKPSNLVLTRRADGSPCVKVIDFGISKMENTSGDATGAPLCEATSSITMLGSPLYMAPEQMRSTRDVDARCDIWSLGCILHVLLTGVPPFRGDTPVAVYEKTLEGLPSLLLRRKDILPGLDVALSRALERNPDKRYANIGELASALGPYASSRGLLSVERVGGLIARSATKSSSADIPLTPVRVQPPDQAVAPRSTGEKDSDALCGTREGRLSARKHVSRRQTALGLAVLGAVVAGALLGLARLWGPVRSKPPLPVAVQAAEPLEAATPPPPTPRTIVPPKGEPNATSSEETKTAAQPEPAPASSIAPPQTATARAEPPAPQRKPKPPKSPPPRRNDDLLFAEPQ